MRRIVFAAAFSLSCFAAPPPQENENPPGSRRHYRTTIRHIESGGIGYKNGYTTLEVFFASDPSRWAVTPFLDVRGHIFDNGKWAANAGAGLRLLWRNRAYGINAYYDYRNTSHFDANQIGAGLETLGELFDFRINGYLPVGAKISRPYGSAFGSFSGNNMLISQKFRSAMKGADAEFGFHFGKTESIDFYAAAGPYYFIGEKVPATWGGKARISGMFKDILTLEISDSYDRTFHNKFQGQVSLSFSFGPKSKTNVQRCACKAVGALNDRMLQRVDRQEIIVIDKARKSSIAIDPATGLPYFFVFVNNSGHSDGTYQSPYHSLVQAQNNSSPNDIIYVFPGDGTTRGMDAGISLKANQKFWGSGVSHSILTTAGVISIPAQSSTSPIITNTDINTDGNAITLAANNAISGFSISSAMNDAIYGTDPQNLEVSFCTIENTTTYAIEASFPGNATISVTNNQFLNNVNGVLLTLNGTSSLDCSTNTFLGQTSVSSVPLEILADSNALAMQVENNVFNNNTTGTIRVNFNNILDADISLLNNTIANNGTGSQSILGSSFVIVSTGMNNACSIELENNTFSSNTSNALYLHTSGAFATLDISASSNTMANNGGSAIVLATPVDTLTLLATDNSITGCNDNGIAVIGSATTTTGIITINNNVISGIGNASNGIAINQDFSNLNLTVLNNEINGCEGTGILSFPPVSIDSLALNISGNTISNCQNGSGNAASAISFDNYLSLAATVENNACTNNVSPSVALGLFSTGNPTVCLTLSGNSCNIDPGYSLTNPGSGAFNLSPCNVDSVNTGTIERFGTINAVQSCSSLAPCPP